jgi:hypothetical protein
MKFTQQPRALMMIRPSAFGFNPLTASTNEFQKKPLSSTNIQLSAVREFDRMLGRLYDHQIEVAVFDDAEAPAKPDSIFPNNWISFHEDGKVVLYPMMALNRRSERRMDLVDALKHNFNIQNVIDLTHHESASRFLEGTGSVVFDHVNRIAYAARSPRTSEIVLNELCDILKYIPVVFDALDRKERPVYHTNVVLSIGEKFAVLCLDAVTKEADQEMLLENFSKTGHKVIAISFDQMDAFAGNVLEVMSVKNSPYLLLSQSAFGSLVPGQLNALGEFAELLPIDISTIEKCGGGSVRCMVAGIHSPKRNTL